MLSNYLLTIFFRCKVQSKGLYFPRNKEWGFESKLASSCYFKVEWLMPRSLLGIMTIFRNQMEMGFGKYVLEKEGILHCPAYIQLPTPSIYSITTRYFRSMTVINICNVTQNSDVSLFCKIQDPAKNDMGHNTFTYQWHDCLIEKQRCDVDDCTLHICRMSYRDK
jgi:hypothetical protein